MKTLEKSVKNHSSSYDVIVVGGGHAGIEAAHAAAKMGSRTLLITLDINKIGYMPCNPAIGGVGKGHLVYEISALGGLMPQLCTSTYLQVRMLNTKKGPAVQGLRLQIDKEAYQKLSRQRLEQMKNLTILQGHVDQILVSEKNSIAGITLEKGDIYHAPTVILTTGTFMNGIVHIGDKQHAAGRMDEESTSGISAFLKKHHFKVARLKTGTPPRLLKKSINFSVMEQQQPDDLSYLFEFTPHQSKSSHHCYITPVENKWWLLMSALVSIDARNQSLCSCFFISGGAINLTG